MSEGIKSLLTEAIDELKGWVTKQFDDRFEKQETQLNHVFDARFEKQEVHLNQMFDDRFEKQEVQLNQVFDARFEKQEVHLNQMFDDRFEKQEMMLEKRISLLKSDLNEEAREHMEALVEQVQDTAGGAYRDELGFVKDKVEKNEERIINLEERIH